MKTRYATYSILLVWGLMVSAVPVAADGGATLAVLGLRSPDGDDKLARKLTEALEEEAALIGRWTRNSANQTLEQLMLINGCEAANQNCYRRIASSLKTAGLVSGSIKRSSRGKYYRYIIEIVYFDTASGDITKRSRERRARAGFGPKSIKAVAHRAITKFAPDAPARPVVELDEPVSMDATPPSGQTPNSESEPESEPEPEPDKIAAAKKPKLWPALTMYGVTAASIGLLSWNWVTIGNVEDNPDFQQARTTAGPGVSDVCARPDEFGVDALGSLCDKTKKHETMQYVFIGTGLVSLGLGTWLLVRHLKGKSKERAARFKLTPMVGKREGGMSARLTF